jgi:hypothetical protein
MIGPSFRLAARLRVAKPSHLFAGGVLAIVAILVLGISQLSSGGVVTGRLYHCDGGFATPVARACSPGEPIEGARIRFQLETGGLHYVAVTDASGGYSVSLPAGRYLILAEYSANQGYSAATLPASWGWKSFSIKAGEHLVMDLHSFTGTL